MYLPLYKVADTSFNIQGDDIIYLKGEGSGYLVFREAFIWLHS